MFTYTQIFIDIFLFNFVFLFILVSTHTYSVHYTYVCHGSMCELGAHIHQGLAVSIWVLAELSTSRTSVSEVEVYIRM